MSLIVGRPRSSGHVRRMPATVVRMRAHKCACVVARSRRRRSIRLAGRTIPCRGRASRLMLHRCTIYRPIVEHGSESAGTSTRYTMLAAHVCCLIQAESSSHEYEHARLAGRVRYRGYFPPDTELRTGDVVEVTLLGRAVKLHVDAPSSDTSGHGEYVVAPLVDTTGGIRP